MTAQATGIEALTAGVADAIENYTGTVATTVYRRTAACDPDYSAECAPRRTVPESEVRAAMGRIAQALRDYPHRWNSTYPPFDDRAALRNADLRVSPDWYVYATPVRRPLSEAIWWAGEAVDLHQRDRDPSSAIARASAALEEMTA